MTVLQDWVSLDGEVEIEFYLPCFRESCNDKAQIKVHWDSCKCSKAGRIHLYCQRCFERYYFNRDANALYSVPTSRCLGCNEIVEALTWRGLER